MDIENGKIIFGYMAMMLESHDPWNSQTVYHHNRCTIDDFGNWWVSKKSTSDAPNVNHPIPGFDDDGNPIASDWWGLWIDWQHPMAKLEAAMNSAIEAAEDASEKAQRAEEAAEATESLDLTVHENRITALENELSSLKAEDIVEINDAISQIQNLIEVDVDGTINKFKEIVSFLAGIGDTTTLESLLQDIANQLDGKQDSGDYATNDRVDELEAKIGKFVVPNFDGDILVFPAESESYFEGDILILAT